MSHDKARGTADVIQDAGYLDGRLTPLAALKAPQQLALFPFPLLVWVECPCRCCEGEQQRSSWRPQQLTTRRATSL